MSDKKTEFPLGGGTRSLTILGFGKTSARHVQAFPGGDLFNFLFPGQRLGQVGINLLTQGIHGSDLSCYS
jgi:hypothetical protein